ncbi:hypothetical protein MRB53_026505 [Persea americana]|uniref:Uncharacterized protein n=1 Tax=Persea americana TaxID=3435 RepID=A0ACC2LIC0_PERAE|nr:hypothetical protein MRB53_026505 [Persea americana]
MGSQGRYWYRYRIDGNERGIRGETLIRQPPPRTHHKPRPRFCSLLSLPLPHKPLFRKWRMDPESCFA